MQCMLLLPGRCSAYARVAGNWDDTTGWARATPSSYHTKTFV